jgi:CheY-like chemotaxis protein
VSISNRRVLVIDDNLSIHDDFRKILSPVTKDQTSLNELRSSLFKGAALAPEKVTPPFEVDTADQGQAGLLSVMQAKQSGRPYAVAFVDMRMPPGWDGMETIENLWFQDPELQVVICSAYSDHPWDEIMKRVGKEDKLLVLQKPFNDIEVWQLATTLSRKWELAAEVSQQMDSMSQLVMQRTAELSALKEEFQQTKSHPQPATAMPTVSDEVLRAARAQTEYLAILGHEIHDPLKGIRTRADQLMNAGLTPAQRKTVLAIQQGVDAACIMIDELLRLAPIESPPGRDDASPKRIHAQPKGASL